MTRNYTYILRCSDGSLYTGWTNDLAKRVRTHQNGQGGKFTRAHRPVELVYYEVFEEKSEAMKREAAIKKLTRDKKLALIREWHRPDAEEDPNKRDASGTPEAAKTDKSE